MTFNWSYISMAVGWAHTEFLAAYGVYLNYTSMFLYIAEIWLKVIITTIAMRVVVVAEYVTRPTNRQQKKQDVFVKTPLMLPAATKV